MASEIQSQHNGFPDVSGIQITAPLGEKLIVNWAVQHWEILFGEVCDIVVIKFVKDIRAAIHISDIEWN